MSAKDFYAIKEWAAGHNFWVYQFFAGGILFGIGLPLAVLFALWRGSHGVSRMAPPRARRAVSAGARPRAAACSPRCPRRRSAAIRSATASRASCSASRSACWSRATRGSPTRCACAPRPTPRMQRHADLRRATSAPSDRRPASIPAGPALDERRDPAAASGGRRHPLTHDPVAEAAFRHEHARTACADTAPSARRLDRETRPAHAHEDPPSAVDHRPSRGRPHRRRSPERHQPAVDGARSRSRHARRSRRALARGVSADGACARAVEGQLWPVPASRAVASRTRGALRRGDRQRPLAIPQLRRRGRRCAAAACRITCFRTACSIRGSSAPIRSSI